MNNLENQWAQVLRTLIVRTQDGTYDWRCEFHPGFEYREVFVLTLSKGRWFVVAEETAFVCTDWTQPELGVKVTQQSRGDCLIHDLYITCETHFKKMTRELLVEFRGNT